MSIAMCLIDVASTSAQEEGAAKINQIDVEIGALAGVMIHPLEFCFDVASRGTMAEGAKLNIIPIEGVGECQDCQNEFPVNGLLTPCPKCEGFRIKIIQGKELRVKSIIIES